MKKRLFALLLTLVIALSISISVFAAASPKSIKITGKTSVHVGNKIELDTKITPSNAKVKDSKIVWSSSNPSVAKVLDKTDEDTEIKGVKKGTATITVKIKGTSIKDTCKITVKKATAASSTASDIKKIAKYKASAKNLKKEIKNTTLASTKSARKSQYLAFEKKINTIERKLNAVEDKWEAKYNSGKASRATYRNIELKVEAVEEYLDTVEDYLESKFNYEFD